MKTWALLWISMSLCLSTAEAQAREVDRLLAAVNGKVITAGDLALARNLNALVLFGNTGPEADPELALSRLIDLELLHQELSNFPMAPADEQTVQQRMEELRQGYAEIGGISVLLRRLGLQEAELESYVRLQTSIMRFVDLRFRPFVTVEPEEIDAYFRNTLVPKLRNSGAVVPALEEIASQIEAILVEQKVNESLDHWIKEARGHSRLEFFRADEFPESETK
jgi:hypothetical protein